jgi:hypothetical protein
MRALGGTSVTCRCRPGAVGDGGGHSGSRMRGRGGFQHKQTRIGASWYCVGLQAAEGVGMSGFQSLRCVMRAIKLADVLAACWSACWC